MIASVDKRFVFLSNPKTGSTAVEKAFGPFAEFKVGVRPRWKHIKYDEVRRIFGEFFEEQGCQHYAIVRHPIETLLSWYRYRAREALSDPEHPFSMNYTGDIPFGQFVEEWGMDAPPPRARVSASTDFALTRDGTIAPVNFYRYESMDTLWGVLAEHIGKTPETVEANVSPKMDVSYDPDSLAQIPRMQRALEVYERIPFVA